MDMDIPNPDELEWLEANSHLHEEDLLELSSPFPPEEERQSPPQSPSPLNVSQAYYHKRLRSDSSDSLNLEDIITSDEKRRKIDDAGPETEEDWLRYAPPQETNAEDEQHEEEIVVDERRLCRDSRLRLRRFHSRLVLEPVNVLLRRVEEDAFAKALQASSEGSSDVVLMKHKWCMNNFGLTNMLQIHLLSSLVLNRQIVKSTSDDILSALRRHSSVTQHKKSSDSSFPRRSRDYRWTNVSFRNSNDQDHENSNVKGIQDLWNKTSRLTGPPEQKILLLCGPPGLGKTTLAHVAAKHCGYRVVEVNASDDRSSSTIEAKILDVVQMNSVMADSRPKCLVIDEIDGALGDGKGAVDVILKMVSAERKSGTGKENATKGEQSGRPSSKKGRKTLSLSRPVICICNDLYAPVLRPLRQVAKVHMFAQPTVSRVVNRLKHICNKEGMKVGTIALTALVEYTECDIRSCLNTLQFLNKKKKTLNVLEIGSQVVGRKDMSKNAFDIWKEIFQKRKMKQERKSSCGSMCNEFDFLHSVVSNRGDYDVIFDGIYENILQLHYHDPLMQKTVKCFNSLGISDLIHQYIMRTQQMQLHAYQPPLAIIVHHLVAQAQKPNIEWPKSYQRCRTSLMERMDILRSWQNKIPPRISRHLSIKSLVEDSISPLLHILSPSTLRPVALHILSQKDRNDLAQLVSTMVSYSVTYKNIKSNPLSCNQEYEATLDASAISLDPPIFDFINFKGYNSGHFVLPLAVKQVLVHEVEKQNILQVSRSVHLTDGCNKEKIDLADGKNSESNSANDRAALSTAKIETGKNKLNPNQCNPSGSTLLSNLDLSARSDVKLKSSGNAKKPCTGSTNFFDR
ncbi:hypothetical protein GH714_022418 [Hevea brasiliensis]|uniref:Chromosome transmission fidelity protein 18 homolog n=1 Tax=Hevea brasiliensis TaxID=3981 RepID=A0A6A6MK47_HEVBR|nr:hypothetical protein GH714_022418 [Hevea brasiliensis]